MLNLRTLQKLSVPLAIAMTIAAALGVVALTRANDHATAGGSGVDFSIGTDTSHGASNTCDSSGAPTAVCEVPTNGLFKVSLYLNQLPPGMQGGKYQGFDARVQFSGVSQAGTSASLDFTPWPDCALTGSFFPSGEVLAGCAVGVGSAGSAYTGRLITVDFDCTADGTITLVHGGPGNTDLVDSVTSFNEVGSEALSIDCSDVTPPPPTPGPTPGPGSLDFSIGIDDAGGTHICDSSGTPTNVCDIPLGAPFALDVSLNTIPAAILPPGYLGYDAYLLYDGLTLDQGNLEPERWPDCYFDAYYADAEHIQVGCATGVGAPASTYTGLMTRVHFACDQPGTITLQHGPNFTDLVDANIQVWAESGSEGLEINCVQPLAYPADTDGDACPDANESTLDYMTGGRRNFYNEWDYLNPTHDGENRIDDVLAVVDQYFVDSGSPAYTQDTDRTFMGPHGWNLGPPDGVQRVDDIVNAVKQYFHDCS